MNYLDKLAKNIKFNQRKQKNNSIKSSSLLALVGVAIAATGVALFTKKCCKEMENIIINNSKDIDEDIDIKRDEIKETLEKAGDGSVGDVGEAMEKALEDLEDEEKDLI